MRKINRRERKMLEAEAAAESAQLANESAQAQPEPEPKAKAQPAPPKPKLEPARFKAKAQPAQPKPPRAAVKEAFDLVYDKLDEINEILSKLESLYEDKEAESPVIAFFYPGNDGIKLTESLSDAIKYTSSPTDVYYEWCWKSKDGDNVDYDPLNALERRRLITGKLAAKEEAVIAKLEELS